VSSLPTTLNYLHTIFGRLPFAFLDSYLPMPQCMPDSSPYLLPANGGFVLLYALRFSVGMPEKFRDVLFSTHVLIRGTVQGGLYAKREKMRNAFLDLPLPKRESGPYVFLGCLLPT